MKKQIVLLTLLVLTVPLACQSIIPASREGTVISDCTDIVSAFRATQPTGRAPQELHDTGIKQGDEFDVNAYFDVLPHLSMQEGYALDYTYLRDFIASFPILAARPAGLSFYTSSADIPKDQNLEEYWKFIVIDDVEQGYFEYAALLIMANQFYLHWHAHYNDTQIVCDHAAADAIVENAQSGDSGYEFTTEQKIKIRTMKNIEPLVTLMSNTAVVELVTFTKWGGFYRTTYIFNRSFPHNIIDVKKEDLVPYDCGIVI